MAQYDYICDQCTYSLTITKSIKEYDRKDKYWCPNCGVEVRRVLTAPPIHFGKGFFKDGYESAKNVKTKTETADGE